MSLLAGLSQQGDSISAHNADAGAHGFGVYTVAQLNAFTNTNRPTGCVYCSDCLVPEGLGSPVVWNGTVWVSTCSGIRATTDLLTYFRGIRAAGKTFYSASGKLTRFARQPIELSANQFSATGTGAGLSNLFDGESNALTTGTTSSGVARVADYADSICVGGQSGGRVTNSLYVAATIWFSALSTSTDEYHARFGISKADAAATIAASEVCLVYDRANANGLGGTPENWLAVTRADSINTLTPLTTSPAISLGTSQELEVLLTSTFARFYINGALVAEHTTNLPVGASPLRVLRPNMSIAKTVGSTNTGMRFQRFVGATYY